GLVGRQFLERLADARRVLGAGRQAGVRVAERQRIVGAEQVERARRMAEVFERVAQQDALAGGDGLDAVAAGAKADVDPAVDVRARDLEQAHAGVEPAGVAGPARALRIELPLLIGAVPGLALAVLVGVALGAELAVRAGVALRVERDVPIGAVLGAGV